MRGLILSGGGVKGAFQCGVIKVLLEAGTDWDYIAGTSVGALNASILGQANEQNIADSSDVLLKLWNDVKGNSSVWKHWFLIREAAGIWKDSFYNAKPLLEMIQNNVDIDKLLASHRQLRFGTTAFGSGEYKEVDPKAVPRGQIHEWIAASAAFPGFLTPYEIDGDLWMDGGVRRVAPLKGAIVAGCDTIDVVLTSPIRSKAEPVDDNWFGTKRNAISLLLRSVGLMSDEIFARDVELCQMTNHLVEAGHPAAEGKRIINLRIFEPKEFLLTGTAASLKFDPSKISQMINQGIARAQELTI